MISSYYYNTSRPVDWLNFSVRSLLIIASTVNQSRGELEHSLVYSSTSSPSRHHRDRCEWFTVTYNITIVPHTGAQWVSCFLDHSRKLSFFKTGPLINTSDHEFLLIIIIVWIIMRVSWYKQIEASVWKAVKVQQWVGGGGGRVTGGSAGSPVTLVATLSSFRVWVLCAGR